MALLFRMECRTQTLAGGGISDAFPASPALGVAEVDLFCCTDTDPGTSFVHATINIIVMTAIIRICPDRRYGLFLVFISFTSIYNEYNRM